MTCFSANAFDGERSGFVIGGGMGYAPFMQVELKGVSIADNTAEGKGVAVSLFAGYGINENIVIAVIKDAALINTKTVFSPEETVLTGFTGLGAFYYFDDVGSSFFLSSGIGLINFTYINDSNQSHETGIGFLTGIGYEFAENFSFYTSYKYGQTRSSFDWTHSQLAFSLMFSVL